MTSYLDQVLASTKATQARNNSMESLLRAFTAPDPQPQATLGTPASAVAGGTPTARGGGVASAAAVRLAQQSLGVPYKWGGNDLKHGVDCSGLVQQVYSRLGIQLPRTAALQARAGQIVPPHAAQAGDLVSFDENPNDANGTGADHIGIYAGNGMMVVAPHTGDVVKMQPVSAIGATPVFTRVPGHPAPIPGR